MKTLREIEKIEIIKRLVDFGGNKTEAVKSLCITIKTLYNKLDRYGYTYEENWIDMVRLQTASID